MTFITIPNTGSEEETKMGEIRSRRSELRVNVGAALGCWKQLLVSKNRVVVISKPLCLTVICTCLIHNLETVTSRCGEMLPPSFPEDVAAKRTT